MFQPWHTWQLMAAMIQNSKCTAKSWRNIKLLEKGNLIVDFISLDINLKVSKSLHHLIPSLAFITIFPSAYSLPVYFSLSLWLSSVSPVSLPELTLLFTPLLWCISHIFLSNPTLSFTFLWTEQTQINLLVPEALSEQCFSYKFTAALAKPWSKDVARGTKGRPESTGVCLASAAVKVSYLCQGLFFGNCLAVLSNLLEDVISKAEHFQSLQPSKEREGEKPIEIQFFIMRKEINLQYLTSKWIPYHELWGCRLNAIRTWQTNWSSPTGPFGEQTLRWGQLGHPVGRIRFTKPVFLPCSVKQIDSFQSWSFNVGTSFLRELFSEFHRLNWAAYLAIAWCPVL